MAVIKAKSDVKQKIAEQKQKENAPVNIDAQERLAEILTDSPRLVSLNGTEWEVRALRMGTQYLIARKCIEINKAENATFGDIIKQFAVNIPAVVEVITLALLNEKSKIYEGGNERGEYSELYKATYETLMWQCDVSEFGNLLFEVLQMLDTSFFLESCRILDVFRESTMTRKKTPEQK